MTSEKQSPDITLPLAEMTHLITVLPLLVAPQSMAVEDGDLGTDFGGGHIETEILLKLQLSHVREPKLLGMEWDQSHENETDVESYTSSCIHAHVRTVL